jgi:hypothetical protein
VLSSSAGNQEAALSIHERARSGARLPPAIAMRSRFLGVPAAGCRLSAWVVE